MLGPAEWGSAESKLELSELVAMSATLNDRRKAIAEYWMDGPNTETPPGHWALLAQDVSRRDHNTLDADVKLYLALANAALDASIAAWDAKRYYDSPRPIIAIPTAFPGKTIWAWGRPGQGTRRICADDWKPLPIGHCADPAVPGVRVGPQHVQRRKRRRAAPGHRKRPVRAQRRGDGGLVAHRTRHHAEPGRRPVVADVHQRGRPGGVVAQAGRDPYAVRRLRRTAYGSADR